MIQFLEKATFVVLNQMSIFLNKNIDKTIINEINKKY